MCVCVKGREGNFITTEKVKLCWSLSHWLSLKAATPCRVSGLLQLFKMANLLFTFLFICLSKMENSKEGVLLIPWARMLSREVLPPVLLMELALCRLALSPGLRKFTSDRYILPLCFLGTDMAESQWVTPSVPWSQDYFLHHSTTAFSTWLLNKP